MKLGKNYLKILCSAFFCFALGTVGCSNGDPTASSGGDDSSTTSAASDEFTVTFDTKGGTAVAQQVVKAGNKVTKPQDPTQQYYTFTGWYWDFEEATPFDFESVTIASNTTIYAGWSPDHSPTGLDNEPGTPTEYTTIYFRDAGWWNTAEATTKVQYDSSATLHQMTHIQWVPAGSYNYWSIQIPDSVSNITFLRYNPNNPSDFWGAKTVSIALSSRGTNNMYDISSTTEKWTPNLVTGVWATYSA